MKASEFVVRVSELFNQGISKLNAKNSMIDELEVDARKGLAIMTDILGKERIAEFLDFKNQTGFSSISHTYNDVRKNIIRSIKKELGTFIIEDNRIIESIGLNIRININNCGIVILLNHMPEDKFDLWSRLMIIDEKLGILDLDGLWYKEPSYIPVNKNLSKEDELKNFTLFTNKINENMNIIKEALQRKFDSAKQSKRYRFKVIKKDLKTLFA